MNDENVVRDNDNNNKVKLNQAFVQVYQWIKVWDIVKIIFQYAKCVDCKEYIDDTTICPKFCASFCNINQNPYYVIDSFSFKLPEGAKSQKVSKNNNVFYGNGKRLLLEHGSNYLLLDGLNKKFFDYIKQSIWILSYCRDSCVNWLDGDKILICTGNDHFDLTTDDVLCMEYKYKLSNWNLYRMVGKWKMLINRQRQDTQLYNYSYNARQALLYKPTNNQ